MQLNILGSMVLNTGSANSLPIIELSDIAWDMDESLLYAISDEGLLYKLKIEIKDNRLSNLQIISAETLKDKNNSALKGKYSDAEGLAIENGNNGKKGDSRLIISFENKPRIVKYSTNGNLLKNETIPREIAKKRFFRNKNKALEGVALHPKYGILTAAEWPLKDQPITQQTIYSNQGIKWNFPSLKVANSSITALEILPDGDVLILERAFNGFFSPVVINLRKLNLQKCNKKRLCKTETIARFDSSDGWLLDNFEGLAHYRDNQYFMISDNNNNPLQKTILVFFEIVSEQ